MSAYRRKAKLFALSDGSMTLRAHTPREGFRFQRPLPPIGAADKAAVRMAVARHPNLSADEQTYVAYRSQYPRLPNQVDIGSPAPSMQKAVTIWHSLRNWVVYYRHQKGEHHG